MNNVHRSNPWCTSLNSPIRQSHLSGGSTMFLLSVVGGRSWGSGFLLLFATFTGPVAIAEVFVNEFWAFLPILPVLLFLALLWKATPLHCKCLLPICRKVPFAFPRLLFILWPAIPTANSLALYLVQAINQPCTWSWVCFSLLCQFKERSDFCEFWSVNQFRFVCCYVENFYTILLCCTSLLKCPSHELRNTGSDFGLPSELFTCASTICPLFPCRRSVWQSTYNLVKICTIFNTQTRLTFLKCAPVFSTSQSLD